MYKLISLDDSENGFYCARCMGARDWTARILTSFGVLLAMSTSLQCKSKVEIAADDGPSLVVKILAIDASAAPRDGRPFIAGEEARITLSIEGGEPPYDLQIATSLGTPTLANASTRVETSATDRVEMAMQVLLNSEVPSGSYGLLLRVTDNGGSGTSVRTEPFEVLGNDAPLAALDLTPAQLGVVDVAGRRRLSFYQGEQIQIQAQVGLGENLRVAIHAPDARPFMPEQRYQASSESFSLRLQIPRVARLGHYRIQLTGANWSSTLPLEVVGSRFPPVSSPVLEALSLLGGQDQRVPRGAILTRGEALLIEARVGGVRDRAVAKLRLRSQLGKVLLHQDLGEVIPVDAHPAARSLLSSNWTPPTSLPLGRHMLEIELIEADEVATIYREVLLQ